MWKTAPLLYLLIPVQAKILGLFVNTLTADDKFSLLNRGRLLQHVRVQLSQNLKTFTEFFFFFSFSEFIFNFEHFKKKGDPHS